MASKRKTGCITNTLYDPPKTETWNQIPERLILLEPCPNCGGVPEVNVKHRKRGGDLYWVDCKTCEFAGPACDSERAARNWWNRDLADRMSDLARRRVDCIPTKVLEKLLEKANESITGYGEEITYSYNWISEELSIVLDARHRIPELEYELAHLKNGPTKQFRQAELITNLATLRKTAANVTPGVYDWLMYQICKKFMEGE